MSLRQRAVKRQSGTTLRARKFLCRPLVLVCDALIYFLDEGYLDVRSNGGGATGIGGAVRLLGTDANAGQTGKVQADDLLVDLLRAK